MLRFFRPGAHGVASFNFDGRRIDEDWVLAIVFVANYVHAFML
jgi:hypothetical protein